VELRAEATVGAVEGLIAAPFLASAACWWARMVVPPRKCKVQFSSPRVVNLGLQGGQYLLPDPGRMLTVEAGVHLFHGPSRAGRSRQGTPLTSRYRMLSTTVWSSRRERPRLRGGWGSSGRNHSHCASLKACRSIQLKIAHFADTP
jgi:hypothetical protein